MIQGNKGPAWAISLMLCAAAALPAWARSDADRRVMLHCAALFDARAKWAAMTQDNAPQTTMMMMRRDALEAKWTALAPPEDWRVPTGRTGPQGHTGPLQDISLTLLTRMAEGGRVDPCIKDALCTACTEMFIETTR